jgi:uncharacterized protein involved in exopolysaccharide biosynthesis
MTEEPLVSSREDGWRWLLPYARQWRLLVVLPALTAFVAVAVTLALPKRYTTTFSFTPTRSELSSSALAGLAGQFGVTLPSLDGSVSPDFYAHLVRTEEILLSLVDRSYRTATRGDTAETPFIALIGIRHPDPDRERAEAVRYLNEKVVRVGFDRQTAVVTVSVRTKWRNVSQELAEILLARIAEYNTSSRQYRGRAEQAFLASRRDTAAAELRAAEDAVEAFLRSNRAYQGDPVLLAAFTRLERELALKQTVFSSIVQAFEAARLTAVRNTPVISIVQPPRAALRFDRRHTLTKLLIGGAAGLLLAILLVAGRVTVEASRRDAPEAAAELRSIVAAARRGGLVSLLRFWRNG